MRMFNYINSDNFKRKINLILILFLLIQPLFDLKVFYNSISTLIRVIITFILFAYYFITDNNNKKYLFLIYPAILGAYFIFHHLNALNFNSLVPGNFNYSIIKETLYMVKMICPYILIYNLYKSKINIKTIFKIINFWILIISFIIIVTNILGISYCNYGSGQIKANFFSWFNKDLAYGYTVLLSKGLFEYGNQISAILLMFLPFTLYQHFTSKKFIYIFITFVQMFALALLGTRAAILGTFLVVAYFIISYLLFEKFNFKELLKLCIPIIILLVIYTSVLPFNPIFTRLEENKQVVETVSTIDNNEVIKENLSAKQKISKIVPKNISKIDFVKNTYVENKINENFILNRYPYIYDTDFWYDIINDDNPNKANVRFLEQAMVKRVIEINNNPLDLFLGITYTRVQNIFNVEKDFVVQFYSLGIIGLILILMPYFVFLFYYGFIVLKSKLKNIQMLNILSCTTILFVFAISYYTGNLLNSLSFSLYFAILFRILLYTKSAKDVA